MTLPSYVFFFYLSEREVKSAKKKIVDDNTLQNIRNKENQTKGFKKMQRQKLSKFSPV